MQLQQDQNKLEVFTEGPKRKTFVGYLTYNPESQVFQFKYDKKYLKSHTAIPVGPELSLKKQVHTSTPKKIFPSLADRIPSRSNPAYKDYCASQGISPNERNPIILLSTIGRRGPSSFVFEPVYVESSSVPAQLKEFREKLGLTQHDLAIAFDLNFVTVNRIERGKSRDRSTLKLIEIFLHVPEATLRQLNLTRKKLHQNAHMKLVKHFSGQEISPD